jgi:recombination protein RecA
MSSVAVSPTIHLAFSKDSAESLRSRIESSLGEQLSSTLRLRERSAPLTVPFGIAALDQLTGGLPRGALNEITGPASSGRTGVMLAALAGATRRQEICALVDASDSFDPASAAAAGVDLHRLLWVRCNTTSSSPLRENRSQRSFSKSGFLPNAGFAFGNVLEQVLKITDLLLQAGGFGMVVLDLGDIPSESARRVPLTSWFRFRRAVEPTTTVLLLLEQESCAKTCASLVLRLQSEAVFASDSSGAVNPASPQNFRVDTGLQFPKQFAVSHATLLRGLRLRAEVVRSWAQRKPPQSVGADVELRAAL